MEKLLLKLARQNPSFRRTLIRKVSMLFNTQEEFDAYKKKHPNADMKKHRVRPKSTTRKKEDVEKDLDEGFTDLMREVGYDQTMSGTKGRGSAKERHKEERSKKMGDYLSKLERQVSEHPELQKKFESVKSRAKKWIDSGELQ